MADKEVKTKIQTSFTGGTFNEIPKAKQDFGTIRQGTLVNELTKTKATSKNSLVSPNGEITIWSNKKDFAFVFPSLESALNFKTITAQFLDVVMLEFTRTGAKSENIFISISEYMEHRGLTDRKEARKQMEEAGNTIMPIYVKLYDNTKEEQEQTGAIHILKWSWAKRGTMCIELDNAFFRLAKRYSLMQYPLALLKLNPRLQANSYTLGRKIAELKNMNNGKSNQDIVSVETLLANSPNLPTYEEVIAGKGQVTQRIIKPFEKSLDELSNIINWEYCHNKGEKLTDAELANFSYELFRKLYIKLNWIKYPLKQKLN